MSPSIRVMLVDDSAAIRGLLRKTLTEAGDIEEFRQMCDTLYLISISQIGEIDNHYRIAKKYVRKGRMSDLLNRFPWARSK